MTWRFTLIDFEGTRTEVDEPMDWDTVGKTIQRDPDWHGIFFSFTQGTLQFADVGYFLIKDEYRRMGVDGDMGLIIEWLCEDCDHMAFRTFYDCKLDFEQFEETCEDNCVIKIGLNNSTPETLLKNRQDTNVDLTSNIAYDGVTTLTDYSALALDIDIPGKKVAYKIDASNDIGANVSGNLTTDSQWNVPHPDTPFSIVHIVPGFSNIKYTDIESNSVSTAFLVANEENASPEKGMTSLIEFSFADTLQNATGCVTGGIINFSYRIKGTLATTGSGSLDLSFGVYKHKVGDPLITQLFYTTFGTVTGGSSISFDISNSFSTALNDGDRYWFFFTGVSNAPSFTFTSAIMTLDVESFFTAVIDSLCEPTPAKTFLIHEAASRVVESITNNAFKFKSEYFGRTDSQPYSFPADGCGGLRAITNGLQLRRALLTDSSTPKVFTNFKDLFQSVNATDAVGIGLEDRIASDPPETEKVVRMEPLRFFYTDEVILYCDGVKEFSRKLRADRVWNTFSFGYDKFETESTNGLDAIHTKREYRTPVVNSSNKLEKICKYIADGYAIEVTRRRFGLTEDWRYDQNIFEFCLVRSDDTYAVEQGNILNGANLFDPPTVINYRLSPIRMALKWFNWLVQAVKTYLDTELVQIRFNSGEGNYVAMGELDNLLCKMEAGVIAENSTITKEAFQFEEDAVPWIKPETISFEFPLGANEFIDLLKDNNKYGIIAFRQFEDKSWEYGWIDSIKYTPEDGIAQFVLTSIGDGELATIEDRLIWIGEDATAECELDEETGLNTGYKCFTVLIEVNATTNVPTGNTKPNDPEDPDYVPCVLDYNACPLPPADVITWEGDGTPECFLDDLGDNTGYYGYTTRRRLINGVPDGYTEPNVAGTGIGVYIPPVLDTDSCPIPEDLNPVPFTTTDEAVNIPWTSRRKAKYGNIPAFQVWVYNEDTSKPEVTYIALDADVPAPDATVYTYHNAGAEGYIVIIKNVDATIAIL